MKKDIIICIAFGESSHSMVKLVFSTVPWYKRVLVERIEEFATKEEWSRAYQEINEFEKTFTDENYIIIKFWIHVDKDEQLLRF